MALPAPRAPARPKRTAARPSGPCPSTGPGYSRWRRSLLASALAVLAVAAPLGSAAAAEPIAVRAAVHPGYGRLVFEWPSPIAVESGRIADRLTLRFARPFVADLHAAVGTLRDYLVEIAPGAEQRELVLRLLPGVEAELATYEGRIVVIDLAAGAAAPRYPVELRTGVHDGFVRIVLDWGGRSALRPPAPIGTGGSSSIAKGRSTRPRSPAASPTSWTR
jgi:hypothetical protein